MIRPDTAERRAGEDADADLLEEAVGKLGAGQAGPGDLRERVERALRPERADPGDLVQAVDDEVAPRAELDDHVVDRALRAAQRLDRADLGERRRAADRVDHELAVHLDQRWRHDRVAKPPAGHGEGLAEAVEDDRPLRHPGQRPDRDMLLSVVQDPAVDLIGEDDEIVADRQVGDGLQVGSGQDAARRVRRGVDDEHPRPRRDEGRELVEIDPEVVLHPDRHGNRRRTDEPGQGFVDRVARVRDEDLVAGVDQPENGIEHHALAADRHEHPIWRHLEALPGGRVLGDRFAELRDPRIRGVVGCPVIERSLRGLPRIRGRVEVGFTDLKVDDVPAGGLEGAGPGGDLERGLGPDHAHPLRDPHVELLLQVGPRSLARPSGCERQDRTAGQTRLFG